MTHLDKHILILDHQGVGVDVSRKRFAFVGICAVLKLACDIKSLCNNSRTNGRKRWRYIWFSDWQIDWWEIIVILIMITESIKTNIDITSLRSSLIVLICVTTAHSEASWNTKLKIKQIYYFSISTSKFQIKFNVLLAVHL